MKINKILGILALSLILSACGNEEEGQVQQQRTPVLPSVQVENRTVTSYKSYPASIEGIVNSQVRAKVSGYIQEVLVDEGQPVRKGQSLFKLETQTLSQDAEAAQAAVKVAQVEVEKLVPLVEKGIIGNIQLETAKANLAQAKSRYNSINANVGYGTIKSPVDGVVGSIRYRKGSLVSPADQQPITTVADISEVYAYFAMNEKEYLNFLEDTEGKSLAEKINNFPEVLLVLANGREYAEKGKIETVSGQVNASTGTVSFRAKFNNPEQLLTNGNSGTIRIPVVYENALVVPAMSTFEQQGDKFVFKITEEGKTLSVKVRVKDEVKDLVVITEGLQKGDQIIAKGVAKVKNGMPVQAKPMPLDSIATFDTVFK